MKFVCFSIIAIEFNGRETLSYGKTSCKSHGWLFWTYFCFDPFYLLYALIICFSSVLSGNTTLLRIVRPRTHFQFDMGNYDITPFTLVESNLCNFFKLWYKLPNGHAFSALKVIKHVHHIVLNFIQLSCYPWPSRTLHSWAQKFS